jgi:molybdopterin synthase catalytic subunit
MAAVRLAVLQEEPLVLEDVIALLEDPASGGLAIFVGRVRNHDHEHDVTALHYSEHPSARARIEEVAARVSAEFDVDVAAAHRVGELAIGDIAVIVAASSGHRGEAFAGCRALIDTIKAEVPIWKHQFFADGSQEWVGAP